MPFRTEYGISDEDREQNLDCRRAHRDFWVVLAREGNRSAFNGYHWTPSAYSAIRCTHCGRVWRTRARYVRYLPDASRPRSYQPGGAIDPTRAPQEAN
jgi:hypothetical protein